MNLNFDVYRHQALFLEDTSTRDLALIGGRGSGKTYSLCLKLIILSYLQAGHVGAALSPTGPMIAKTLLPGMIDALEEHKIKYNLNRSDRRFDIQFGNKTTTLYCLSAENVRDGLGLNLAFFGLDEADTMHPDVAFESWRKLSGALRSGNPLYRQKVAVSTPEGYGFCYRHWVKDITPENEADRRIIHAKTRDNLSLTEDFFNDLRSQYPEHYLKAYMLGEFCNMTSGSVYPDYDRILNHTNLTYETLPENITSLHIGMDFNVKSDRHPQGIAAIVGVVLNGRPHIIDELYGASRTTEVIEMIKEKYKGKTIYVYPDASGASDRTSASVSDRTQLNAAGFIDRSPLGNPRIKDRVTAVNALIKDGHGNRRLLINKDTCPILSDCLIQQPYDDKGAPQKDTGLDDPVDGLGYFINVNWPVKQSTLEKQVLNV